eukprot:3321921-Ditylum_brightwellii.AAC.1
MALKWVGDKGLKGAAGAGLHRAATRLLAAAVAVSANENWPRYQPSTPCGDQELCLSGSSKISTLVPGGARGVLLKSCMLLRWAWAERRGLDLDVQSKLRVSWACSNSSSHWQMGKAASVEHNPAMKCSLK